MGVLLIVGAVTLVWAVTDLRKPEGGRIPRLTSMNKAFEVCRAFADANDMKALNRSRGGDFLFEGTKDSGRISLLGGTSGLSVKAEMPVMIGGDRDFSVGLRREGQAAQPGLLPALDLEGTPPDALLAALSHDGQTLLAAALRANDRWMSSTLTANHLEVKLPVSYSKKRLAAAIRVTVEHAVAFRHHLDTVDIQDGLLHRAVGTGVLARPAQLCVLKSLADTPRGRTIAENVLDDADQEIHIRAVLACGQGALNRLLSLVAVPRHEWYGLERGVAEGFAELIGHIDEGRLLDALSDGLDRQTSAVFRQRLIHSVARKGPAGAAGVFIERIERHGESADAGLLDGLVQLADPTIVPEVERLLQVRDLDDAHRVRLIETLGELGRRQSVAVLTEFTEGLLRDGAVKAAARAAVLSIQARLGSPDAGGLALAEGSDEGGLTLGGEAGEMTLAED